MSEARQLSFASLVHERSSQTLKEGCSWGRGHGFQGAAVGLIWAIAE